MLFTASINPLFVIIAVIVIAFLVLPTLGRGGSGGSRRSRGNPEEADRLIGQAEMLVQTGKVDSAASLYSRAISLAGDDSLLISEAYYGLHRCAMKSGDLQAAARHIDSALSYAPEWREYKPNFETLLQTVKRETLDEISKSLPGDN